MYETFVVTKKWDL